MGNGDCVSRRSRKTAKRPFQARGDIQQTPRPPVCFSSVLCSLWDSSHCGPPAAIRLAAGRVSLHRARNGPHKYRWAATLEPGTPDRPAIRHSGTRSGPQSSGGAMKDRRFGCKILSLERKCSSGVGRLKSTIEDHLHGGGLPSPDIWEKTLSFLSVKKAPLFHNGYSRCSREALRLFPDPADDVAPLCYQQ
ncbi:hypothetical protein GN956_G25978 [Arapaima gigas]